MSERRASALPDRPRVLLAEEETLLRDALQGLLARDLAVVAAVADFESMRREIVHLGPHVVVAGLSLLSTRDGDEMRAFRVAAGCCALRPPRTSGPRCERPPPAVGSLPSPPKRRSRDRAGRRGSK